MQGVDGLWIDMLFAQPKFLAEITKDSSHISVKESWQAIEDLLKGVSNWLFVVSAVWLLGGRALVYVWIEKTSSTLLQMILWRLLGS